MGHALFQQVPERVGMPQQGAALKELCRRMGGKFFVYLIQVRLVVEIEFISQPGKIFLRCYKQLLLNGPPEKHNFIKSFYRYAQVCLKEPVEVPPAYLHMF